MATKPYKFTNGSYCCIRFHLTKGANGVLCKMDHNKVPLRSDKGTGKIDIHFVKIFEVRFAASIFMDVKINEN